MPDTLSMLALSKWKVYAYRRLISVRFASGTHSLRIRACGFSSCINSVARQTARQQITKDEIEFAIHWDFCNCCQRRKSFCFPANWLVQFIDSLNHYQRRYTILSWWRSIICLILMSRSSTKKAAPVYWSGP